METLLPQQKKFLKHFVASGNNASFNQGFFQKIFPYFVIEVVMCGVGYHHAGLDTKDRKTIESVFLNGELPVLCK